MLERCGHDILAYSKRGCGHLRKLPGNQVEHGPVVPCFPWRIHGLGERMDKGMHVCGGQVIVFIPVGGRQDNIGIDA